MKFFTACVIALTVWGTQAFAEMDRCASPSAEEFAQIPTFNAAVQDFAIELMAIAAPLLIAAVVAKDAEIAREMLAKAQQAEMLAKAQTERLAIAQTERERRQAESTEEESRRQDERAQGGEGWEDRYAPDQVACGECVNFVTGALGWNQVRARAYCTTYRKCFAMITGQTPYYSCDGVNPCSILVR